MTFVKNIETHYGAVGDGTTNDRPAFLAWKAAAQGLDSELILRAGAHYYFGPQDTDDEDLQYFCDGIPTLLLRSDTPGTRTTITDAGTDYNFHLGVLRNFYLAPVTNAVSCARINTVATSATTVVLQTDADHSLFTVGDWVIVAGLSLQGAEGYPPSFHFFEYKQIASKQTSVSPYSITLDAPLDNSYRSDWADWGTGNSYTRILGPAAIYRMSPGWDVAHEYRDLVVDKTGVNNGPFGLRKSTNCAGRAITLRNVKPTNYDGINPSIHISHSLYDCDYRAVHSEVDKLIDEMLIDNCQMGEVEFQSSSNHLLTIRNGTTFAGIDGGVVNGPFGTPQRVIVEDCEFDHLILGARTYGTGAIGGATITNCVIKGFTYPNYTDYGGHEYYGGDPFGQPGLDAGLITMVSGVIRVPRSYTFLATTWMVPDSYCMFRDDNRSCIRMFRITSVYSDTDYIYAQTSESGGFPTSEAGPLRLATHPCSGPVAVTNSSYGAPAGTDNGGFLYGLNGTAYPLFSFSRYKGNGKADLEGNGSHLWGNLVSATADVTVASSGSKVFSPFGSARMTRTNGSSTSAFAPTINLNSATTHTYTDSDLPESGAWFAHELVASTAAPLLTTGSQSVLMTIRTDQGILSRRTYQCTFV